MFVVERVSPFVVFGYAVCVIKSALPCVEPVPAGAQRDGDSSAPDVWAEGLDVPPVGGVITTSFEQFTSPKRERTGSDAVSYASPPQALPAPLLFSGKDDVLEQEVCSFVYTQFVVYIYLAHATLGTTHASVFA